MKLKNLVVVLACLFWGSCQKEEQISLLIEEQNAGVEYDLQNVYFQDAANGYIVGGENWFFGVRLQTQDGGETWEADSLADKLMYTLHFDEEGRGYSTGIEGQLYVLEEDWRRRFRTWETFTDLFYWSPEAGVLVGGEAFETGWIYRSGPDYQIDTIHYYDQEISAVDFVDESIGVAVGYGIFLRTEDAGLSWTRLDITGDFFQDIEFVSDQVGYVVGLGGTVLKTLDAGATWTTLRNGRGFTTADTPFRALAFIDEQKGYIVGDQGTFWRTLDGGTNWQIVTDLPKVDCLDIHIEEGQGWIVGKEGHIFHFWD